MDTEVAGRHRKRGTGGLVATGALIALSVGFLGGVGTERYVLEEDRASDASTATASADPPEATSAQTPAQTSSPEATGSAAPADPAPPGPQGARAYLARLADAGLPVGQHRDAILVLGRVVCEGTAEERADERAATGRVTAVAGDLLSDEQAARLAEVAVRELCGT